MTFSVFFKEKFFWNGTVYFMEWSHGVESWRGVIEWSLGGKCWSGSVGLNSNKASPYFIT